ncbi:MAG TPA: TIGR03668 family PPOX class F420-dependent oxidoreductase [Acidimicrobiia bacterium]|nr:TIGR03668 family PPOX class F420-dependent oxidoreductase [Acidimicrobiia bacterium]
MTEDEMRERVGPARVARLASVRPDGTPHLVPICFALVADGTRIVSAVDDKPKSSPALQRLTNIRANPAVTLLVDHYEEDWARVWWVRVDGRARVVEDGPERDETGAALRAKYEQYERIGLSSAALVIDVERWRGWAYSD